MNWYLIILLGTVVPFGILGFLYLGKESNRIHRGLDDLRGRATSSKTREGLLTLRNELVEFARKECWHRAFGSRAHEICAVIDGRLSEMSKASVSTPQIAEVLNQVAWLGPAGLKACPICHATLRQGHKPDCNLALALKSLGEDVRIQTKGT